MEFTSGRPFYTEKDMEKHRRWLERQKELAVRYGPELEKAASAEERLKLVRQFYEETGPVPFTVKTSMAAALPYVAELINYEKEQSQTPRPANAFKDGYWICSVCGSKNSGRFCSECGSPAAGNAELN